MSSNKEAIDKFLEANKEMTEANIDLIVAGRREWMGRWNDKKVEVPITLVNFPDLMSSLNILLPDLLGKWSDKLECSVLIKALFADLAEPLVDYINTQRRSTINQLINSLIHLKVVEASIDSSGQEIFFVNELNIASAAAEFEIGPDDLKKETQLVLEAHKAWTTV